MLREHASRDGRTGIRKAAERRREDAQKLLEQERWTGSIYLHGYWVECTIKFRLMDHFNVLNLDALDAVLSARSGRLVLTRTHSIAYLSTFHEGLRALREGHAKRLDVQSAALVRAHNHVSRWSTELRYSPEPGHRPEAERFAEDAKSIVTFILNN